MKEAVFFKRAEWTCFDFDDGTNTGIIHLGSPVFLFYFLWHSDIKSAAENFWSRQLLDMKLFYNGSFNTA